MDSFLREHLEDYLAGDLSGSQLADFEGRLSNDPAAAALVERFRESSALFAVIRVEPSEAIGPEPGFYGRLSRSIDEQKRVPFWMAFLQPALMRQVAFATLMWLFMLGAVTLFSDTAAERNVRLADRIVSEQPSSDLYYVRMGPDLERNRATMLAVMMDGD